jgi:glyceraldehyde-3-phosphate dehydrogenase (NADP+)
VPVASFTSLDQLFDYYSLTPFGQQASVFTTFSPPHQADVASLLDILGTAVGRININTQCGRSPDSVPFSGRRSSALGTMSVTEALNAFSVEVVVAAKATGVNDAILQKLSQHVSFLSK